MPVVGVIIEYLGLVTATLKMHSSVKVWAMYGLCDRYRDIKAENMGERMLIEEVRDGRRHEIGQNSRARRTKREQRIIVDKKNQLDVTFCILYFSSNSCSTCFGQPCAHHQELTTA